MGPCPWVPPLTWRKAGQGLWGGAVGRHWKPPGIAVCRASVRGPSLTRAGVVATATNPPPTTPTLTPSQGSSDDQQVHERGADPEGSWRYRQRPVSAPSEHGHTEDTSVRVPCPRRGDGRDGQHAAPVTSQVPATLTAGPDGALWVTVDGADVQQVAARISAVCDMLIPARSQLGRNPR
jgi:hypothetical protein